MENGLSIEKIRDFGLNSPPYNFSREHPFSEGLYVSIFFGKSTIIPDGIISIFIHCRFKSFRMCGSVIILLEITLKCGMKRSNLKKSVTNGEKVFFLKIELIDRYSYFISWHFDTFLKMHNSSSAST